VNSSHRQTDKTHLHAHLFGREKRKARINQSEQPQAHRNAMWWRKHSAQRTNTFSAAKARDGYSESITSMYVYKSKGKQRGQEHTRGGQTMKNVRIHKE